MNAIDTGEAAPALDRLPGWFVTPQWLEKHLHTPGLRIVQIGGDNYYGRVHIPGAVLLNYTEMVRMADGVPGMRAKEDDLVRLFGRLGITRNTPVVAYDGTGGADSARLVWTLYTLGHRDGHAAVLDGGIATWFQEKRPMQTEPPRFQPVQYRPRSDHDLIADMALVRQISQGQHPAVLLDTRSTREYQGMTLSPPRGHIPGALHLDWLETLVSNQDPRLKDPKALVRLLTQRHMAPNGPEVVVYCQTAHRAAHTWVLLRHMGFPKVRLYDGSMAEWGLHQQPVLAGKNPR
jgi:thiosulfate/3-mercaptopyruvate sulfurtransferase